MATRKKDQPPQTPEEIDLRVTKGKLTDLIPDNHNANRGTQRGIAALDHSIRRNGVGRGILADKKRKIIGGNKTVDRLVDLGFEDVIYVPTDGKTLVVTVREDLDLDSDPQARELAYADNRVSELDLDWDEKVIAQDLAMGLVDLGGYFTEGEALGFLDDANPDKPEEAPPQLVISPELFERQDYVVIYFDNKFDWQVFEEKMGIGPVISAPVEGKTLTQVGLSRVVSARRILEMLK